MADGVNDPCIGYVYANYEALRIRCATTTPDLLVNVCCLVGRGSCWCVGGGWRAFSFAARHVSVKWARGRLVCGRCGSATTHVLECKN